MNAQDLVAGSSDGGDHGLRLYPRRYLEKSAPEPQVIDVDATYALECGSHASDAGAAAHSSDLEADALRSHGRRHESVLEGEQGGPVATTRCR